MSHTFTNLLYHVVFSTKDRHPWLDGDIGPRPHAYLGGAIRSEGGIAFVSRLIVTKDTCGNDYSIPSAPSGAGFVVGSCPRVALRFTRSFIPSAPSGAMSEATIIEQQTTE